jgi:hypothetical protein
VTKRLALLALPTEAATALADGKLTVRQAEATARGKEPAKVPAVERNELKNAIARLEADNQSLRDLATKARQAVADVRAELDARPEATLIDADESEPVPEWTGLLLPPVISKGGRSFNFAGFRCRLEAVHGDPGVVPTIEWIVGAITQRQTRVPDAHGVTIAEIDDDTCLGCNGTGLWNGEPCSDCQPEPEEAPTKCPPTPTDEADAPGITPVEEPTPAESDVLFDPSPVANDNQTAWETEHPELVAKAPWPPYPNQTEAQILPFLQHTINKVDTLRAVIAWELRHDTRPAILATASARLTDSQGLS